MSADDTETEAPKPRKPARRRWAWRILAVLVVVLGVLVVRAVVLVRATPDYWQENRVFLTQTPDAELSEIAQAVENRLPSEWTRPIGKGDGLRTIRIHYDEVNAWLAVRMPQYLENQNIDLPREVGQFMLTQRDGEMVVAFDYESRRFGPRIASLFFQFRQPESDGNDPPLDAGLEARLLRLRAGEQNLSVSYLTNALRDHVAPDNPDIQAMLTALGRRQFVKLPLLPVDDYRQAAVLGIDVQPTGLDVTVRVRYNRDVEAEQASP
ncbi:MAG: hypothetical protein AAF333_03760 [Planctomycetota bacterium]